MENYLYIHTKKQFGLKNGLDEKTNWIQKWIGWKNYLY